MQNKHPERLTLLAFFVSTILAGNNAIAVRFSNVELPPFFGAAVRFAAASLILFAIVLALRLPLPKGRSMMGALIFGALQFGISYALIYWSLLQVPAGLFQVVLALVPLFTFLLAMLHRQENFQWSILIGGLIAVAGIAIIFRASIQTNVPLPALLAAILSAICIAESVVLLKGFPKSHPVTTNALAMAMGAAILFATSWLFREVPTLPTQTTTWMAVLYLILFGSVITFILVLFVLSHWTASASSYQLVLMPLVTVLFASWLANERITLPIITGGLLVLIGVCIGVLLPPGFFRKVGYREKQVQGLKTPK